MKNSATIDIKIRHNELCEQIEYHNNLYFNLSNPEISDQEFDKLFNELLEIENNYTGIDISNSPSQRIGSNPISEFEKIEHKHPMMSIEKVYNQDDLNNFLNKCKKETQTDYSIEYKIDGLAISLIYEKGKLIKAITRGNGKVGENVIENVKVINSVPLQLNKNIDIEIRGEVYMSFNVFNKLNEIKKSKNEEPLANPRNAAAGALKRKDSKISKQSKLSMIAYEIIDSDFDTHEEVLKELINFGFEVPKYSICSINDIYSEIEKFGNDRPNQQYLIDGVVVKVNNIKDRKLFGSTSTHPKWLIAYKFQEEVAETKLLSIDIQVGKTGILTPVANLESIELCGTNVQRASLHNFDYVKSNDIRINDIVKVKKAGEIIPQIIGVNKEFRNHNETYEIKEPTQCPICKSDVAKEKDDQVALVCLGDKCPPKLKGKVEYWASKTIMNIDGMGPAVVEQLYNNKLIVNRITDIYNLTIEKISKLDRMGPKSAVNLYNEIQKSIDMPFESVLAGLQIPNVGRSTSKLLVKKFKNIDNLKAAKKSDLIEIDGIGNTVADNITNWFKDEFNLETINILKQLGFNLNTKEINSLNNSNSNIFANQIVCVTGKLLLGTREDVHSAIELHGGEISTSITKKTTILICGENVGSKLAKAKQLGIKIITENDFYEILKFQQTLN